MFFNRTFWMGFSLLFFYFLGSGCAHPKITSLSLEARYGEIIDHFENQKYDLHTTEIVNLYFLCEAYWKSKRYSEFFTCIDKLLPRLEKEGVAAYWGAPFEPESAVIDPLVWKAYAFMELGNYKKSLEVGKMTLRQLRKVKDSIIKPKVYWIVQVYSVMGLASALNGDREAAEKYAQILYNTPTKYFLHQEQRITNLSKIYMALGQYNKALEILPEAITAWTPVAKAIGSSVASFEYVEFPRFYMLHKAQLETGKLSEAKAGFIKLLSVPRFPESRGLYRLVLSDLGTIALKKGNIHEAIEYFKKAIEIIEEQRSTINTETSKIGFVGDKQAVYRDIVASLIDLGRHAEAFSYAERGKARALVDMLASKKSFGDDKRMDLGSLKTLLDELEKSESNAITQDYRISAQDKANTRSIVVRRKQNVAQTIAYLKLVDTIYVDNLFLICYLFSRGIMQLSL